MSYIPANSEIRLYVRDPGTLYCDMGCRMPALLTTTGVRLSLDELVDLIRQHVVEVHAND